MKIRASKLDLRLVDSAEEYDFLKNNHYQGYIPSRVAYGLYNGDELVVLMTFGTPRYNGNYSWELLRLCTKQGVQVYGGASKLFNYFIENNDAPNGVISYCNRDKFSGDVYKILGFQSKGITKGYHYEKDGQKYHRSNFTKANCLKLWPEYIGKNVTEKFIMAEQGYTRVEDKVGQETFIFNDPCKYYIYKLTFEDGATYIGSHVQYKERDKYITSSRYAKDHKIVNREILLYVSDQNTLSFIESMAIMQDKCNSIKNVNGNLGNYVLNHLYNIGTRRNYKWSEERRAIAKSRKHGPCPEETRRKISEATKGLKKSPIGRKNMSDAQKGQHWWTDGQTSIRARECPGEGWKRGRLNVMSDEARKRLSELNKGKKISAEVRKKISTTLKEVNKRPEVKAWRSEISKRPKSEEHKRAIAESVRKSWELRNHNTSEETKKKISEALKGKSKSAEHVQSMKEAWEKRRLKDQSHLI